MDSRRLTVDNESVLRKTEGYRFYSVTHRLFKLPGLEPACEDYGQAVKYLGGVAEQAHEFKLDDHHVFQKGKIVPVCGNTWMMLADTRFRPFFEFHGNFTEHYGIFPGCGTDLPYQEAPGSDSTTINSSGCC